MPVQTIPSILKFKIKAYVKYLGKHLLLVHFYHPAFIPVKRIKPIGYLLGAHSGVVVDVVHIVPLFKGAMWSPPPPQVNSTKYSPSLIATHATLYMSLHAQSAQFNM